MVVLLLECTKYKARRLRVIKQFKTFIIEDKKKK